MQFDTHHQVCFRCNVYSFVTSHVAGLAKKEDLPYVTYYCPRCNFLNASEHYQETRDAGTTSTRSHNDNSRGEQGREGGVDEGANPTLVATRKTVLTDGLEGGGGLPSPTLEGVIESAIGVTEE